MPSDWAINQLHQAGENFCQWSGSRNHFQHTALSRPESILLFAFGDVLADDDAT
jgi:hypothetical protein